MPNDRWSLDRFYNENPDKPNKIYTRKGGFLDEAVHRFDATFFNITPREAVHVDPQQRLLMEVAWESMEDAGVVPETLAGSETGVYIGGFTLDSMLDQLGVLNRENISMHSGTGALMTLLSNRISYFFDFRGPSLSVDTACSSSLVAVHLACQDLWRGHASMALAGGVNVMLRPEYPMIMGKGHFLAPDGYCKSFDERANGYSRGEGAGVVLLKPYAAAVRDGDHIYATIRGTGVNQDGRTDGITMPSALAQEALIRRVYAQSGVPFSSVRYVEAHGTGTPVGDPIEAGVLGRTIGAGRDADEACLIGSAKSTIGHLEAAAGVAGLIKAALCLDRGAVPPQANLQNPNPKIPFQELGIRLATSLEPLSEKDQEVYCGVNSFGFGGTNAHVVLQRVEKPQLEEKKDGSAGEQILLLSGRDPKVLTALAQSYAQLLSRGRRAAFEDICHAARIRRSAHECRLSVVAASAAEMATELEQFAAHGYSDHVVQGKAVRRDESRPVFVFTGMGPQWWGMGRQLLESEPVFRKSAEEIDELFRKLAGFSILDEMREDKSRSRVKETRIAQPANFVVQVGLAELLRSWGVYPAAVVGHSVGEVSAAYISGALSLEDAVAVSYHRSRLQQLAAGKGRMLATALNREQAERLLESYPDTVSVAAINSVSTVTLAGDGEALASIAERLTKDEIFNRFLDVEVAYHSPQMEALKPELRKSLEGIRPQTPHTPLYSTVTGQRVQGPDWGAEYWCSNMREPVVFADAMAAMVNDGLSGFVEVGPHPVLSTSIKEVLRASESGGVSIATLRREHPERATILAALGALYVNGYDVNWRALSPAGARFVKLPLYPWQREFYWNETNAAAIDRLGQTEHLLLGSKLSSPMPTWEHDLGRPSISYLADHVIEGAIIFPAAGYIEQGLAMAGLLDEGQASYTLEGLSFLRPLVFPTLKDPIVRAAFDRNLREFHIYSQTDDESASWTLNAMGRVLALPPSQSGTESLAEVKARIREWVDVAELYDRLAAHGLAYGPNFRTIRNLMRNGDEILAELEIIQGPSDELSAYRLHPALLDGAIQTLVGAIGQGELEASTYLPVGVGRVVFRSGAGAPLWAHGRIVDQSSEGFEGDLVLYRADGGVAAEIRGIRCKALHTTKLTPEQRLESRSYGFAWEVMPLGETEQQVGDCLLIASNPGSCNDLATALEEIGAKAQTIDAQSLTNVATARKLIDENPNLRAIVFLGRSDTNIDDAVSDLGDAKRLLRLAQALEGQDASDAPPRLLAATLGVLFACVLVFMQLGFRDSLYTSAASAPLKMQGQLFLLHKQTEALWRPVSFERSILMRALGLPAVQRVEPLYMSLGQFKNMDTHIQRTLMIYGYDPNAQLIRIDQFESFRDELQRQDTALFDVNSRPEFGPVQKLIASGRDIIEINGRKVKLVGTFSMGTTFAADGNVVMSDLNFHRVFPSRSPDQIDLGFIMLAPDADIVGAQRALLRLIGQDVRVLTYEQLVRFEQAYWENSAPLGFVFGFGTLMGLIVGMVIVYQILFTDIGNNIPQYATLVAMGYSQSYLRNIVFASSIYLAIFGFLPGVVLSTILYEVAERSIFIPFPMGVGRIASVFFFILTMCAFVGLLAIRKLKSTDPADMFQ